MNEFPHKSFEQKGSLSNFLVKKTAEVAIPNKNSASNSASIQEIWGFLSLEVSTKSFAFQKELYNLKMSLNVLKLSFAIFKNRSFSQNTK